MLYETLKWPQIAPFCISSKKKSQTLNGISSVALATGIVNKTHSFINIVFIEG
jgi:hypothetical protein